MHPSSNAIPDECPNLVPPDCSAFSEQQRDVEKECFHAETPQVDSQKDFVVEPKIIASPRMLPSSRF